MTSTVETHISSAVVHCRPDTMAALIHKIEGLAQVSVEAQDRNGKLVILLETQDEAAILDGLSLINNFAGVLSTNLVYHQVD